MFHTSTLSEGLCEAGAALRSVDQLACHIESYQPELERAENEILLEKLALLRQGYWLYVEYDGMVSVTFETPSQDQPKLFYYMKVVKEGLQGFLGALPEEEQPIFLRLIQLEMRRHLKPKAGYDANRLAIELGRLISTPSEERLAG